jgi:hypothetical protein
MYDDGISGDDLAGVDDLAGDDLVGARKRRGGGGGYGEPDAERILPLDALSIAAGASEAITVAPQEPFRIKRLTTTESAPGLLIDDFRVGVDPVFVQAGSVPNAAFAPTAVGMKLRTKVAKVGNTITLVVRNPTAAPIDFAGLIVGDSVL